MKKILSVLLVVLLVFLASCKKNDEYSGEESLFEFTENAINDHLKKVNSVKKLKKVCDIHDPGPSHRYDICKEKSDFMSHYRGIEKTANRLSKIKNLQAVFALSFEEVDANLTLKDLKIVYQRTVVVKYQIDNQVYWREVLVYFALEDELEMIELWDKFNGELYIANLFSSEYIASGI